MSVQFSVQDLTQIKDRGSYIPTIEKQIQNFIDGFPPLKLEKAAHEGDGIVKLSDDQVDQAVKDFQEKSVGKLLMKFVPASGAASRMFKDLFAFVSEYDGSDEEYQSFAEGKSYGSVFDFFKNIEHFAFYQDLKRAYARKTGQQLEEAHLKRKYVQILEALLKEPGLNYGGLPKGLLKFHEYHNSSRTPAEEHMVEGAHYARQSNDQVQLHFTVSPEHSSSFDDLMVEVQKGYEDQFGVKFVIGYSEQKSATDTIAVDLNNDPFRNPDGTLLFRPAGHGALIENLNDRDADVIFIKNIDNVVPDHLKDTTYAYKMALGGILLRLQEKVAEVLNRLDEGFDQALEKDILGFLPEINVVIPREYFQKSSTAKKDWIRQKLNRPVRVCGMVRNEGDPGGGPFWVSDDDGGMSLQIVETAQIDLDNPGQKAIFNDATHFNPVDLVCGIKDYKGNKFDLLQYVDPKTGFITKKSKDGEELKAQELPGLWNGAMAKWISIFVEVPVITFNPVKKVNDLLKPEHQPDLKTT